MESVQKQIGRHKYAYLKNLSERTQEQEAQLKAYEESRGLSEEQIKKTSEYFSRLGKAKAKKEFNPSLGAVSKIFFENFKSSYGKEYEMTEESKENLRVLIYYFCKHPRFFECTRLVTMFNINGVQKKSVPSFEKGILIIGNYGNGKTSTMQTFERIFKNTPFVFKGYTANNVVEQYEICENTGDKKMFWNKMNMNRLYFDDVKTERHANNYGKANLFKDILEKRYQNQKKTYITCNYKFSKPQNLNAGIMEFGELYGGRVFDRLFEMFNVIEFKGKSFRK